MSILGKLILLIVVMLPFYSVGIFIGSRFISILHILAVLICLSFASIVMKKRFIVPRIVVTWMKYFIWFLAIGLVGLLVSPYGSLVWQKGVLQLAGISVALVMSAAIVYIIHKQVDFFVKMARYASIAAGIFALIGCLQFLFWNFTPLVSILKFYFLNDLMGGDVWRDPGKIGPLARVNSIAAEPTHYARLLCFTLGWALMRVGVVGRTLRKGISEVMSTQVAYTIILGYFFSLSVNAILPFMLIVIMLVMGFELYKSKVVLKAYIAGAFLLSMGSFLVFATEGGVVEKFSTAILIFSEIDSASVADNRNRSALAIAANMHVSFQSFALNPFLGGGLGSHPVAYQDHAPLYVYSNLSILGVNSDDAAGLMLRLLSETGIVGLCLFVGGIGFLLKRARRAVLVEKLAAADSSTVYISVSLGLTASLGGVFVMYLLRTGHYYAPSLWVMIAMVAAIPMVLEKKAKPNSG